MAPQVSGLLTFTAGLLAGMATLVIMMAPLLAKGLEAHHRLAPSRRGRRGRRRMILAYDGLAAGALCIAGAVLVPAGTPLQRTPLPPILSIAGFALIAVSQFALVAARGNRGRAPLAGSQEAPGGSAEANGPQAT